MALQWQKLNIVPTLATTLQAPDTCNLTLALGARWVAVKREDGGQNYTLL